MSAATLADFAAGIAWTPVVNADVILILEAPTITEAYVEAAHAFMFAARRRTTGDLRAHLWRIRTALRARTLELSDQHRQRLAAHDGRIGRVQAAAYLAPDPWQVTS